MSYLVCLKRLVPLLTGSKSIMGLSLSVLRVRLDPSLTSSGDLLRVGELIDVLHLEILCSRPIRIKSFVGKKIHFDCCCIFLVAIL